MTIRVIHERSGRVPRTSHGEQLSLARHRPTLRSSPSRAPEPGQVACVGQFFGADGFGGAAAVGLGRVSALEGSWW